MYRLYLSNSGIVEKYNVIESKNCFISFRLDIKSGGIYE